MEDTVQRRSFLFQWSQRLKIVSEHCQFCKVIVSVSVHPCVRLTSQKHDGLRHRSFLYIPEVHRNRITSSSTMHPIDHISQSISKCIFTGQFLKVSDMEAVVKRVPLYLLSWLFVMALHGSWIGRINLIPLANLQWSLYISPSTLLLKFQPIQLISEVDSFLFGMRGWRAWELLGETTEDIHKEDASTNRTDKGPSGQWADGLTLNGAPSTFHVC